jgi:uncharacterized phage protein (TIGR02220 family)
MNTITIPLEFFKAIGEKHHNIRLYWIKWLGEYSEHLFRPDFVDFFHNDMKGKNLNLETIKEAYEFGMVFFKDGLNLKQAKSKSKYSDEQMLLVEKVITYLNEKSNSTYTCSKANIECIVARTKEGYTISDFKIVIDNKVEHWSGTEQEKYLRPITLFSKKFENYLNEPKIKSNARTKPTSSIGKISNASEKAKQFFN